MVGSGLLVGLRLVIRFWNVGLGLSLVPKSYYVINYSNYVIVEITSHLTSAMKPLS